MRIVFVISQLSNGGAERMMAAYANALAQMGEEVHVVSICDDENDYVLDSRIIKDHWLVQSSKVNIPKVRGLCNIWNSVMQIRRLSGDIIIPFCMPVEYYMRLVFATLFSKTRLLYAVRCDPERDIPSERIRRKRDIVSRFADGIWIQTEEQRRYFPRYLQRRIFEVHNILDEHFLNVPRTNRERIRSFISVGRLHPQKNHKMLIEAFVKMIRRTDIQDATLTIYGKARADYQETEEELKALILREHMEDRIFLPGRTADIEAEYERADAFVFGSDYEGCPNALMEAMAAGLPCVSTDCPTGPSMLIESGKNGILVPVGDADAMSRAMEWLIRNPRTAYEMGMAAKQRMRTWESSGELAEQLLRNLRKICWGCGKRYESMH